MQPIEFAGKIYSFSLPKKILFGTGISEKVGLEAKELGGKDVLLVTDKNLEKRGIPQKIKDSLIREDLNVEIFSDVEAEPSLEVAESIAEAVRRKKFNIVVGCGGGSVLDMAKIAAMAATNPGIMKNYIGVNLVKKPSLPKILLPTTAGTGSEVTNIAVVTLTEDEIKSAIVSHKILGDVAMVDPSLTFGMPPSLTASTGFDALSHSLEALMSIDANPITDSLSLQALNLIFSNLVKAYETGNIESRVNMSLGSLMAGMAFGNAGVCLGHAVAYTFAPAYHVAHGISCSLVLPFVFKFNASAISSKIPRIAESMHIITKEKKTDELTISILEAIFGMMEKLQMPKRLREVNVPRKAIPEMVEKLLAMKRLIRRNPKKLTEDEAFKLIDEMW
jgi:alcohol dehydrogenase class IV